MAFIGLWAILLILVIVFVYKVGIGIIETLAIFASRINEGWKKIWYKKEIGEKDIGSKREYSPLDRSESIRVSPTKYPVRAERFGISGKCEICGKEFTSISSASENYLVQVDFEFYGKKRNKSVCKKCLQLLAVDSNCKITKIYDP